MDWKSQIIAFRIEDLRIYIDVTDPFFGFLKEN